MPLKYKNKNIKFLYYSRNLLRFLEAGWLTRPKLEYRLRQVAHFDQETLQERLNYYNKLTDSFSVSRNASTISEFRRERKKVYFFDLYEYLRFFARQLKFDYLFGDINYTPDKPTLLKSRPIEGDNANAVLLNLEKVRHFNFINDTLAFENKIPKLVWRGAAYQPHRQEFVRKCYNLSLCDVGQTDRPSQDVPWQKPYMAIADQLKSKFIFSIEGNDVATNLKWIMSSNSLCFMRKPKFETWFMEGRLIPDKHYVCVRDDYEDLEDKINYYAEKTDEAQSIIDNAHRYINQFNNPKLEDLISLLVLQKYFEKSGQL